MPIVYVCVECDPSKDLKGHYFGCRDDGLRDMIWYWDDRDCDATGLPIPPRKVNLPCTVECGAGYYLPYGETACVKCKPGTFSMGGGARFQHFDAMPAAVRAPHLDLARTLAISWLDTHTEMGSPAHGVCLWYRMASSSVLGVVILRVGFRRSTRTNPSALGMRARTRSLSLTYSF